MAAIVLFAAGTTASQAYLILASGTTSVTETVSYGGRQRNVLYIKPSQSSSTKVPMLVMLHYAGGNPEQMASLTEVSELVRDFGIWVMLPAGVDGKFNIDPNQSTGVDDVGFIANRITNAIKKYPILSTKVYMTGYSNGGFEAMRFACERPAMVAAIAVTTTALIKQLPCSPARTVPVAIINGTADARVDYNSTYGIYSAHGTAEKWASINGCTAAPAHSNLPDLSTSDNSQVTLDAWNGCRNGSKVWLYSVIGGGHTWPGSPYNAQGLGAVNMDITATLTAWEFVRQFSR
ncbi:MAG TPA: PHB depolymerase family esterase [Nevskiaceae bacterium]|nr:PHB depolymerase family esterase [Nevskiaceae bacterium]